MSDRPIEDRHQPGWDLQKQSAPPPAPMPVPAVQPFGQPLPVLVQIGDISCTATTVHTPSGEAPIGSVFWNATDMSHEETRIPPYAIVLAIVFALVCLVGLLFLLIKERRTTGYVQVTVQGPGFFHSTNIPASFGVVQDVFGRVNYARGLTAYAKNQGA